MRARLGLVVTMYTPAHRGSSMSAYADAPAKTSLEVEPPKRTRGACAAADAQAVAPTGAATVPLPPSAETYAARAMAAASGAPAYRAPPLKSRRSPHTQA